MGRSISMYYYIAYAYFAIGDYRTSLRWVNTIIASKTDLRSDLLCFTRLLSLILHVELDNYMQLEYVFRSTHAYFIKRERLYQVEDCFLKCLKKIFQVDDKQEQEVLYRSLKKELQELLNDPFEKRSLEYFDFMTWLDSKIERKPFAHIKQTVKR